MNERTIVSRNSSTMSLWPYRLRIDYMQYSDGMVDVTLNVAVIDGTISLCNLSVEERFKAAFENFATIITVEAENEHWSTEM